MMWQWCRWAAVLIVLPSMAWPTGLTLGPRAELTHPGKAHEIHLSGAAVAIARDGGRSFDSHLRGNEDRPSSHGFEGLAAAEDGTVILSWIDSRDGGDKAATYTARNGGPTYEAGRHSVEEDGGEVEREVGPP
jgi:hypothetical protein